MKKRSLVSAIAMLVVSAIVLTSATFAWFAAGSTAKVEKISASVQNSAGAIELSVDGESWTTNLTADMLKAADGNLIPENLQPVSGQQLAADMKFVGGTLATSADGTYTFTPDVAEGSYVKFKVYVRATVGCTVDVDATFSNEKDFIFAAVADSSSVKVESPKAQSYIPFVGSDAAEDANKNSIIDIGESAAVDEGNKVTGVVDALDTGDSDIVFNAGEVKTFTYFMWVEGQHALCKDTVQATPSLELIFTKNA